MTFETPVWIEAVPGDTPILLSAQQYRTIPDALYSAEGVCGLTDLVVTQRAAGANMSVDVSTGEVVIRGDAVTNQGKYICRSTAVSNWPIATAPGTGSRTDLVVAQLYDKQADGGTLYAWTPLVITGSTTAPASSVILATVTVPAGTASITTASNISITGSAAKQFAQLRAASYRPTWSVQVSDSTYSTGAANFTSGQWPAVTFTMPPSGMVIVTIGGDITAATTTSKLRIDWSVTAGDGNPVTGHGMQVTGGELQASRRTMVTGTPGTSQTITPSFNVTATGSANNTASGLLLIEPIQ